MSQGDEAAIVTRMSKRFYTKSPLAPGSLHLQGAEVHHLATVCRLRAGDQVCLFNGDGRQYPAQVVAVGRKHIELQILRVEVVSSELPFRLEVAAPLPKGDRAQFLIEKLTELGVTGFTPLQTGRSVVHPRESKLDRPRRRSHLHPPSPSRTRRGRAPPAPAQAGSLTA